MSTRDDVVWHATALEEIADSLTTDLVQGLSREEAA